MLWLHAYLSTDSINTMFISLNSSLDSMLQSGDGEHARACSMIIIKISIKIVQYRVQDASKTQSTN